MGRLVAGWLIEGQGEGKTIDCVDKRFWERAGVSAGERYEVGYGVGIGLGCGIGLGIGNGCGVRLCVGYSIGHGICVTVGCGVGLGVSW